LQKETKRRKFVNFSARLSEKKVVKVLLNIQGTADKTKNQHLKPQSSSKIQFKNLPEKPYTSVCVDQLSGENPLPSTSNF
jgi:hypothetical protein